MPKQGFEDSNYSYILNKVTLHICYHQESEGIEKEGQEKGALVVTVTKTTGCLQIKCPHKPHQLCTTKIYT